MSTGNMAERPKGRAFLAAGGAGRAAAAAAVAAYVAALGVMLWPALRSLHPRWLDFTYSHGYLVIVLTAVLVVAEYRRARFVPFAPSAAGLAVLACAITVELAGRASATLIVSQLALPLVLWSAFWAVAGWRNALRMFWPLAYLYFAIPFWDAANEPLRQLTTAIVSWWVRLAGMPAFIVGNRIHIPSGTFEVAGGCSGLHFFIVGLALSAFYGLMYFRRWRSRLILGAAALALSLVANWLRVFTLVVVGHWSEMQHYLIVEDHYYFGWVLFFVVFAPVFWLGMRLEAGDAPAGAAAGTDAGAAPSRRPVAGSARALLLGAAALVLGIGLWLGQRVEAGRDQPPAAASITLPAVAGWRREAAWADARRPRFVGAAGEAAAWYRGDATAVAAYVASYPAQRQGREIVFYANRPQGEGADVLGRGRVTVAAAAGRRLPFAELRVADAIDEHRLVWYGMQVAGRATADPIVAKAYQALGAVTGRQDAQALVLSAACVSSCERARAALSDFAARGAELLYVCARPAARSHAHEQEQCDAGS